jgi:hypothetical protein
MISLSSLSLAATPESSAPSLHPEECKSVAIGDTRELVCESGGIAAYVMPDFDCTAGLRLRGQGEA